VYNYLISNEFKQRMEIWVEYFRERQEKINKERIYFNKKWQEEEKSIQKVMVNTAGIYGDLQGLMGSALPKVSYLELPEEDENEPKVISASATSAADQPKVDADDGQTQLW
jgi:hypothetical protein